MRLLLLALLLLGATGYSVVAPAAPAPCTTVVPYPATVERIINTSSSEQAAEVTLYDEGQFPTCARTRKVYTVRLGSSQIITLNLPLHAGLAYTTTGAVKDGILLTVR